MPLADVEQRAPAAYETILRFIPTHLAETYLLAARRAKARHAQSRPAESDLEVEFREFFQQQDAAGPLAPPPTSLHLLAWSAAQVPAPPSAVSSPPGSVAAGSKLLQSGKSSRSVKTKRKGLGGFSGDPEEAEPDRPPTSGASEASAPAEGPPTGKMKKSASFFGMQKSRSRVAPECKDGDRNAAAPARQDSALVMKQPSGADGQTRTSASSLIERGNSAKSVVPSNHSFLETGADGGYNQQQPLGFAEQVPAALCKRFEPFFIRTDGAVLIVDVSGYSRLTARLNKLGKIASEALTKSELSVMEIPSRLISSISRIAYCSSGSLSLLSLPFLVLAVMNQYFHALVMIVETYDGDIVKVRFP
jgi:hypothetical protein